MGVQIAGNTPANIAEVESASKALRVTPRPIDYGSLGVYSLGAGNGATAMAAALAANSPIWSFRWGNASNLAAIKKVLISAGDSATAFAAGAVKFELFVARSFSASDTGGTSILPSGNQNKLRSSMGTTLLTDARISATATLTAGTRTLDTNPIGGVYVAVPATAGATLIVPTPLFQAGAGDHPIILAQNEGLVIQATVPGTGTWFFSVQAQWEELAAY
jgi:hypothetical protein